MSNKFSGFEMPKTFKAYSRFQSLMISLFILIVVAFVVDYVTLPSYNLHDIGFITLLVIYLFMFGTIYTAFSHRFDFISKAVYTLGTTLVVLMIVLSFLSSEFLNASKYRDQIVIKDSSDFNSEFNEIEIDKIPLVDQNTAQQLVALQYQNRYQFLALFRLLERFSFQRYSWQKICLKESVCSHHLFCENRKNN